MCSLSLCATFSSLVVRTKFCYLHDIVSLSNHLFSLSSLTYSPLSLIKPFINTLSYKMAPPSSKKILNGRVRGVLKGRTGLRGIRVSPLQQAFQHLLNKDQASSTTSSTPNTPTQLAVSIPILFFMFLGILFLCNLNLYYYRRYLSFTESVSVLQQSSDAATAAEKRADCRHG